MSESPHSTNFFRISTFQCWILLVIWYHSVRILVFWWVHTFWWGILILNHSLFKNCLYISKFIVLFLQCLFDIISLLLVIIYQRLHDEDLVIQIVVQFFSILNCGAWVVKYRITEIGQWLWKFGSICCRWELISEKPGETSVFSTWFGLSKFGILGTRV